MARFAIVVVAMAFLLGTLAVTPLSSDVRAVVIGAAFLLAGLAAAASPRFAACILFAVLAGALNATFCSNAIVPLREHRTARFAATVLERAGAGDGSTEVTLALSDGTFVSARLRGDVPETGTQAIVRGRLEPFDDARNPGEPSQRDIEEERGIRGRLEAAVVLRSDRSTQRGLRVWLARAHEWAHAQLQARLGEPDASVVAGELWGERAALSPALRSEFQETGTVHVLVTAGLHLGAVAALCAGLLTFLTLPRRVTCAASIVLVWAFVWWSGAQLPAMRAATMASAALAARTLGRATLSWNALAIAAIIVALSRPHSVATASFALSFSCVGAIFACAAALERSIGERIALPSLVREAMVLALATQIGIWPLGAAIFLQLTPYAILANLAVVPCVALTMGLGAAQLLLAWCAPLAQAVANLNSWFLAWTLGVVQAIAALPSATLPMTPAPAWCIALYDAAVLASVALWRRGAQTLVIGALGVTIGLVLWPPRAFDGRLRVTVLDVGQADAIVIQTPHGHALLVDAGGRLERGAENDASPAELVGERTVVPFLLRHGVHHLDALIVSHPHGDHAGGVAPVLRRLRVAELADSGQRYGGHAYRDAIETALRERVPIRYPRAGTEWQTDDGVTLHFIGPSLPFIAGKNAINSNSVAFLLRYRAFRMLFTGDAGSDSERRFLAQAVDLRADVLKVGHHGSAYGSSAAFIGAVAPRYAIVSVGRHNTFGHPAEQTIDTLRRFGAQIYRTDEDGAVTVATDGRSETVESMLTNSPASDAESRQTARQPRR
ncbi:MAG: DNA internalization-related competence protein ComEC/Rec2 [Candidatus Eremiobacteraeota bacterium]|nr:DNA internalization-related competence protein ComEC/Rec2 [Candidatus Eremiobacteraeota bacterium]